VYYIQYAHARTCSVLRKLLAQGWEWQAQDAVQHLEQLQEEHEKSLLRRLDRYPEVVATAALHNEPHTVATYLRELAGDFHTWYNAHKMLVEDRALRDARVALSQAVGQVIANGLGLLGVSAPEVM
jgi:arginyl-tRNA synthetase